MSNENIIDIKEAAEQYHEELQTTIDIYQGGFSDELFCQKEIQSFFFQTT